MYEKSLANGADSSRDKWAAATKLLNDLQTDTDLVSKGAWSDEDDEVAAELRKYRSSLKENTQGGQETTEHQNKQPNVDEIDVPESDLPFYQIRRARRGKMAEFESRGSIIEATHSAASVSRQNTSARASPKGKMHYIYVAFERMSDFLKGLLRQDRSTLHKHFAKHNDTEGAANVCKLDVHGALHAALLPFLWPGRDSSYWQNADPDAWCSDDFEREVKLLGQTPPDDLMRVPSHSERCLRAVVTSVEDERQALQFLQDFNILAQRSHDEWFLWDLTGL